MFQFDITTLEKNIFQISKYVEGMNPNTFEKWPFWRVQMFWDNTKEAIEEEKRQRDEQEKQQNTKSADSERRKQMSDAKKSMPSMPKTPKIK
jgi:short subunit dehydrogenase-like uncharacterized protein